ncbi:MAG: hypothetical protein ABSD74_04060 [Rhizomicrobium sp.]|jgi:hypothetical protein
MQRSLGRTFEEELRESVRRIALHCLPAKDDGRVAVPSSFRDSDSRAGGLGALLHCTIIGQAALGKSKKIYDFAAKIRLGERHFSIAAQWWFVHIVAARHYEVLRDAAALPGRFLPELGRSPERPFS